MCKKSTKANWIALPRIRLFSQFAQRTINKSNNVWRRNVCRSQCRNMENKEADQKLGNGTWVSKPKKIFTHVQCIYKCILHFCQCNENCIVFVPLTRIFRLWGYIRNEIVLWEKGGRLAARRRRCQREWVFLLTTLLCCYCCCCWYYPSISTRIVYTYMERPHNVALIALLLVLQMFTC